MSEYNVKLTVVEVCQCVHLPFETLVEIVDTGIVDPEGEQPTDWEFDHQMLDILRTASRLQRDLEIDWNGVALAMSLLDELQSVRAENQRLRHLLRHVEI